MAEIIKNANAEIAERLKKKGNKPTPAQVVALHTMSKVDNFEELNADTGEEGDKKILEITRKLWKEFQVHGRMVSDGQGGTKLMPIPDVDGKGFVKILELAGFDTSGENVKYGKHSEHRKGGLTGDASNNFGVLTPDGGESIIIDHHEALAGEEVKQETSFARIERLKKELIEAGLLKEGEDLRDTSATKFAYKAFIDAGLLEESEELKRFVDFITDEDNEKYTDKEVAGLFGPKKNFSRTLMRLSDYLTADQIWEILKKNPDYKKPLSNDVLKNLKGRDPLSGEEKPLWDFKGDIERRMHGAGKAIEELSAKGFEIDSGDSRFGKILIDTGKIMAVERGEKEGYAVNVPLGFLPVRAAGYGAYVIWIPEQKRFKIYTKKPLGEVEFEQGLNIRGCFWNSPSSGEVSKVTLEEILTKLSGKEIKIEGKLKEAMGKEDGKRATFLENIKKNNERIEVLRGKTDPANFNKEVYGEKNIEKVAELRERLEKIISTKLGARKDQIQWEQKLKALDKIEEEIDSFIQELLENPELLKSELHYIKKVYIDFAKEYLAAVKTQCTEKLSASAVSPDDAIEEEEKKFWEKILAETLLEDGTVEKKNISLAVEEIRIRLLLK